MAEKPEEYDPLANAIETLRELRGVVNGLYDRLIGAHAQIAQLEQDNIILRFQIEQEEARVRAMRGLENPAHPDGSDPRGGSEPQDERLPLRARPRK